MGEAFLHQSGNGMRYRGLSATLAAPYNVFYTGQAIDISHAVITADLGKVSLTVPPSACSVSPATAANGTTSITISYTIGAITRSATVSITVIAADTFGNTSWANIALMAYYGYAKLLWNLGDEKTEVIDGVSHTWRIIGFDHDPLSESDAKYNDANYNRGAKKAALTIQWKTAAGTAVVSSEPSAWYNCSMRTTTLPALLESMPSDLKNNVRTVKKMTYGLTKTSYSNELSISDLVILPETIFLLSYTDANYVCPDQFTPSVPISAYKAAILTEDTPYAYFAYEWTDTSDYGGYVPGDYLTYDASNGEQTRILNPSQSPGVYAWRMRPESEITQQKPKYSYNSDSAAYFPVFNI